MFLSVSSRSQTLVSFTIYAQDPHESDDIGWSDAGHYVTGCSKDWISLRLVDKHGDIMEEVPTYTPTTGTYSPTYVSFILNDKFVCVSCILSNLDVICDDNP